MESFAVSMQFGFPCIAIFFVLHHIPSVCVPVCLAQDFESVIIMHCSRAFVGIISCITRYHIHLVFSDTGASFKFFHILVQSVLGHSFVWAFQGIQPQDVCLLKGMCKVFSYGICGFKFHLLWAYMPLLYCIDKGNRISLLSFSSVGGGLGVLTCRCLRVSQSVVKVVFVVLVSQFLGWISSYISPLCVSMFYLRLLWAVVAWIVRLRKLSPSIRTKISLCSSILRSLWEGGNLCCVPCCSLYYFVNIANSIVKFQRSVVAFCVCVRILEVSIEQNFLLIRLCSSSYWSQGFLCRRRIWCSLSVSFWSKILGQLHGIYLPLSLRE